MSTDNTGGMSELNAEAVLAFIVFWTVVLSETVLWWRKRVEARRKVDDE